MWPRGVMKLADLRNRIVEQDNYKMLDDGTIGSSVRANVAKKIFPSPGTTKVFTPLPLTVISSGGTGSQTINTTIVGELDGCFFTGGVDSAGVVHTPEDFLEQGTVRYRIIPSNTQSLANRPYQFFVFRED